MKFRKCCGKENKKNEKREALPTLFRKESLESRINNKPEKELTNFTLKLEKKKLLEKQGSDAERAVGNVTVLKFE